MLSASSDTGEDARPTSASLSFATYNVHGWVGTDGRLDYLRVIDVIRELGADVVGLQEAIHDHKGRMAPTLEELSDATGMAVYPGVTMRRGHGQFGNLLLTRRSVVALERLDLSVVGREPRGALCAGILESGMHFPVVITHLGLRGLERRRQLAMLLNHFHIWRDHAFVVMGDFNEWNPASRVSRVLARRLGAPPLGRTYPAQSPVLSLDRIGVGASLVRSDVRVHRSPLARVASDHLPLCSRITLRIRVPG